MNCQAPNVLSSVFGNEQIVSQHNSRNFVKSEKASKLKWKMSPEIIPDASRVPVNSKIPAELYNLTKDTTDYAWFTTR